MDGAGDDAGLAEVLAALREREPIFHRPELGTTRADFERQTAPDFWETGASGRRYSREYVWSVLEGRRAHPTDDPWVTSGFRCRRAGPTTYLLTYTLRQGERVTRRMTLWEDAPDGWRILYHQGTVVEAAALAEDAAFADGDSA